MNVEYVPDLSGRLPQSWYAKESITLLAGDGEANVIASSEPLDYDIDSAVYAKMQGDLLRDEFPGYSELTFESAILFGDRTGFRRTFTWTPSEGVDVYQIQLYVAENGRGYTATATTPVARRHLVDPLLQQILGDLRIGPTNDSRWVRSDSPDTTRKRVESVLTTSMGPVHVDSHGWHSFQIGSIRVWIAVEPWHDPGGLVTVFAPTNQQVPRSPELFEFLALHSEELVFGRLGAWPDGTDSVTTVVRCSLLGSTLDPEEALSAITVVADSAERLSHLVESRFGGEEVTSTSAEWPQSNPAEFVEASTADIADDLPVGFYL